MSKPQPKPMDPAEVQSLAREVLREDRFPHLATIDGDQPRVRPVSPVRTEGFTVYVANLRSYRKTEQIARNPRVELCYLSPRHDQVRITGIAHVEADREILQSVWDDNPLLRNYLGSIDNPGWLLYRIEPTRVQFMREWALDYHDVEIQPPADA